MTDADPTRPTPDLEPRVAVLENKTNNIEALLVDLRSEMRTAFAELRTEMRDMRSAMRTDFRWLLAALAALLGVLAHGFHWI